jgi:hypothetical protein
MISMSFLRFSTRSGGCGVEERDGDNGVAGNGDEEEVLGEDEDESDDDEDDDDRVEDDDEEAEEEEGEGEVTSPPSE